MRTLRVLRNDARSHVVPAGLPAAPDAAALPAAVGNRRPAWWSLLAALVLAAVLLVAAFRGVAWGDILATVRQARPGLLALALVIVTTSCFARATRWRVLLTAKQAVAPLPAFWATVVGYMGNNFLPARAGELFRTVILSRKTGLSIGFVAATAITERLVDAVTLVLISVVALASLPGMPDWLQTGARSTGVVAVVGLAGFLVVPLLESRLARLLLRLPLPHATCGRASGLLQQFLLGMRALQQPSRAFGFLSLTGIVWLLDALTAVAVAKAFALSLTLPQALLLVSALGLVSAVPSTPGNVGIYQFVAVTVLIPFSYSRSEALAYILAFQAVVYAATTIWGLVGLWRLSTGQPRPH